MARDLNKYLTELTVPSLTDADFINQFDRWVRAVNENFEKIISAPFLKGDKGNSIDAISLTDVENYGFLDALIDTINTYFDVNIYHDCRTDGDILPHTTIISNNPNSIDNTIFKLKNGGIVAYKDDVEGTIQVATPYIFLDARLNELRPSTYPENFVDKTMAVAATATWDENDGKYHWDVMLYNILPTLYFDEELSQWCWNINGEKTGIIAQGIAGKSGQNASIKIVKGYPPVINSTYEGKINITHYLNAQLDSVGESSGSWSDDIDINTFSPTDVVLCFWYPEGGDENDIRGAVFGPISWMANDEKWAVKYLQSIDIIQLLTNCSLRSLLNTIGQGINDISANSTDGTNVRGLYIPVPLNSVTPSYAHMWWFEPDPTDTSHNTGKVIISKVPYNQTGSYNPSMVAGPYEHFELWYNTDVKGGLTVAKNLNVSGNTNIQGQTNIQGSTNINGALTVNNATTINSILSVQQDATFEHNATIKNNAYIKKHIDIDGDVVESGILRQNGARDYLNDEDSTMGLAVIVDLKPVDLKVETFIHRITPVSSLTFKVPTGIYHMKITMGYLGYAAYAQDLINADRAIQWYDPSFYRAKTYEEDIYITPPTIDVLIEDIGNPQYTFTHSSIVRYLGHDYTLNFNLKLENLNFPTYPTTLTYGYSLRYSAFQSSGDLNISIGSNQYPLWPSVTVQKDQQHQSITNYGFLSVKNDVVEGETCFGVKIIKSLETSSSVSDIMQAEDYDGTSGWTMHKLMTHNQTPNNYYEVVDLNMNGYFTTPYQNIPIVGTKLNGATGRTTFGITNISLANTKIFPEGHVGYVTSEYIYSNLAFGIGKSGPNQKGKLYQGGMVCDMSKGLFSATPIASSYTVSMVCPVLSGTPISPLTVMVDGSLTPIYISNTGRSFDVPANAGITIGIPQISSGYQVVGVTLDGLSTGAVSWVRDNWEARLNITVSGTVDFIIQNDSGDQIWPMVETIPGGGTTPGTDGGGTTIGGDSGITQPVDPDLTPGGDFNVPGMDDLPDSITGF